MSNFVFTSESVTEGHPDKICDQISDAVLDALLYQDPFSRVACETVVNTGLCLLTGEITTKAKVDYIKIARNVIDQIGYRGSKSGDFDISDGQTSGEFFIKIRRFIPDFKVLSGNAKVTLNLKDFPAQTESSSSLGPFTVQSSTNKIDTRARARFASLKIENESTDENWRFGSFRADTQADGRR